jgi:hypothetical protein
MTRFVLPVLALSLAASPALAADRHLSADAGQLSIESPCAAKVTISPDASLNNRVEVDASAQNQQEVDQLELTSGHNAKLRITHRRCWEPDDNEAFEPTLALTIRVPNGMPLGVEESGSVTYRIGPVAGDLSLDLSGHADIQAERVKNLNTDMSGSGQLGVNEVTGNMNVEESGSAKLSIAKATSPDLNLELSGSGSVHVGSGSISRLKMEVSGSAPVEIDATVGDAMIDVSGSGDISVAKVTGNVMKSISGSGDVRIGGKG